MRSIWSLFAKSPFGPLQNHMAKVSECVERLQPLFKAVLEGNRDESEKLTAEILQLESDADAIKNETRNHLPKSLFLPVDRRDLLEILHLQDDLADGCQDIAVLLSLRAELRLHEDLHDPLNCLLKEVTGVCTRAAAIIQELDELLETAFAGPEAEKVLHMVEELNVEETVTDDLGIAIAKKLFALEEHMSSTEVMLWFRIFRQVGKLANHAEAMGNRVRLLIAT